ncbi:MAG: HAD-IB family hydrolase [Alphaproteobacteria bacterium]|nr:HAD-IB family hydrolase [Alphaproteobacteria bacterium]
MSRKARAPAAAVAKTAARVGSVEEIEQGPSGKSIAAIFDFDGTLIAGYSALDVAQARLMKGDIKARELIGMATLAARGVLGLAGFKELIAFTAASWRGRKESDLMQEGERLFKARIADRVFPEMKRRLEAHRAKGHTLIIASSATPFQVEPAAKFLGVENVLCTRFEVVDGRMTGKPKDAPLWGEGKANAIKAFAKKHRIELKRSYAYADGNEEVPLMLSVGNPRPTNPQEKLEQAARTHNWPVQKFSSRGRIGMDQLARNLAAIATIGPIATFATAAGILNNDVRSALNILVPQWGDVLHAFAGVKLQVTGEENLWSHRPAVFVFNHRTNFDAFIVGKLLRVDYTGVAKKELEMHPVMGPVGRLMKVAFIDRSDTKKALESMKSVVDLAGQGISIVIAPEGTRAQGRELLPFKKGAFRMAMTAGIPIVPIVIRNADDIGARDAIFMRPGTVEVTVLPPISVADWTLEDLDERIDAVRDLFVATLGDWPDGGLKLLGVKKRRKR